MIEPFESKAFLSAVGAGRTVASYRSKGIVFAQGDPADSVFYIERGKVKLSIISPRGKEAIVAMLGEGLFFGEGCLAAQSVRMATAMAIADSTIVEVRKSVMQIVLAKEPEFSGTFIRHLLARNIRIEEDLVDHFFNSSEKRLARILLLLANYTKDAPPDPIAPNISQEALAEMVGTTRSRVSYFLNKFRKLGFIEYGDGLRVHGSLASVILHD